MINSCKHTFLQTLYFFIVFSFYLLGHSAFTGIAVGVLLGISNTDLSMIGFAILFALVLNLIKRHQTVSTDTIISVFSFLVPSVFYYFLLFYIIQTLFYILYFEKFLLVNPVLQLFYLMTRNQ